MTIEYDPASLVGFRSFPRLLVQWRGTIFPGVFETPTFWIVLLLWACFEFIPWAVNAHRKNRDGSDYEEYELPPLNWSISTIGIGLLFFFMVFYNNNCYQRFMLFHSHCVGISAAIMEWAGLVRLHLPRDLNARWNAVRCVLAAMHLMYHTLHTPDIDSDEWHQIIYANALTEAEVQTMQEYPGFKPWLSLTWALEEVKSQLESQIRNKDSTGMAAGCEGLHIDILNGHFKEIAFKFRGHCGQIVNLLNEPVPFPYFHLLNVMLLLQLSLTAYALATLKPFYIGLVMMTLVSTVLLGMRSLAVQLSNPFGDDSVDFDLGKYLKSTHMNTVAYLVQSNREPSGTSMPDEKMRNPLIVGASRVATATTPMPPKFGETTEI